MLTSDVLPLPNPYRHLTPHRCEGQDFIIAKGMLFFVAWDRERAEQIWKYERSLTHRFRDRVIAWEYARFLDGRANPVAGETRILAIDSVPDICITRQVTPVMGYASYDEQRSDVMRWLTTYTGVTGK